MQRLTVLLLLSLTPFVKSGMMPGGTSDVIIPTSQDDPDVQKIRAESVQTAFAGTLGSTPPEFYVEQYKKQVVAGMNYFAKIRYDSGKYAHIRVFVALPHMNKEPELAGVQMSMTKDQEVTYFEPNIDNSKDNNQRNNEDTNSAIAFDWSIFALFFVTVFAFVAC